MAIEGKLCLMPPDHLHVELAEPRVVGQAGLLRRCRTGTLSGQKILRQNDATLKLLGALVGTLAEVNDAAVLPEALPVV